jgi:hypothetical protein
MRLPEDEREAVYMKHLGEAEPAVVACKLADIYDNVGDTMSVSPRKRAKTVAKSQRYLDALKPAVTPLTERAFRITTDRVAEVGRTVTA